MAAVPQRRPPGQSIFLGPRRLFLTLAQGGAIVVSKRGYKSVYSGKRFGLILVLAGLSAVPARANLRPPLRVDGFVSGGLRTLPLSEAVKLVREELRFVFPDFKTAISADGPHVGITVRYEIVNRLSTEIEFPVHFLAVDIQDLTASLDDQVLPVGWTPDPAEKSECLWKLARHRSSFMSPFYQGFLAAIRQAAGLKDALDDQWLAALEAKDLAGFNSLKIYPRKPLTSGVPDFRTAALRLRLRPGAHVLQISYSQWMFIDERGYGYSSGWPKKGFSGVDYLLYPATSWPLDANFRLNICVEIPELAGKRLFGTAWTKPKFRSNLSLGDDKGDHPHVRILRGEFPAFPSDILTVLVWFDDKALNYVSIRPW